MRVPSSAHSARGALTAQMRWTIAGLGSATYRSSYARTRSLPRATSSNSPGFEEKRRVGRPAEAFVPCRKCFVDQRPRRRQRRQQVREERPVQVVGDDDAGKPLARKRPGALSRSAQSAVTPGTPVSRAGAPGRGRPPRRNGRAPRSSARGARPRKPRRARVRPPAPRAAQRVTHAEGVSSSCGSMFRRETPSTPCCESRRGSSC